MRRPLFAALAVLLFASVALLAQEADLVYVDDVASLAGTCYLRTTGLSSRPPAGLSEPTYRGRPLYGALSLADETFPVVLDVQTASATLYADPDASGILVEIPWKGILWEGSFAASALFQLSYGGEGRLPYRVFFYYDLSNRFRLSFCRGGYVGGTLALGGASYRVALVDENTDGDYSDRSAGTLYIDLDQDGALLATSDTHERYSLNEPVNVHGVVFEVTQVARDGSRIELRSSPQWVEERLPLEPGNPAPAFAASTTAGDSLSLAGLRGRVVLLDFWASWCGPCVEEFPALLAIAAAFADTDLVLLGVNLDRDQDAFAQAVETFGLSYAQIYEGVGGPVASLYRVSAIPMTYLIDRNGTIHAKGLRGEALLEATRELVSE